MLTAIKTMVVGLICGFIAKLLLPGNDSNNPITTMVAGIIGSMGATYGGRAIGWVKEDGKAGWIASIAGAMACVLIWRFINK